MSHNAMVTHGRDLEPVFDRKRRRVGVLEYINGAAAMGGPLCQIAWVSDRPGAREIVEEVCRLRGGDPTIEVKYHLHELHEDFW